MESKILGKVNVNILPINGLNKNNHLLSDRGKFIRLLNFFYLSTENQKLKK